VVARQLVIFIQTPLSRSRIGPVVSNLERQSYANFPLQTRALFVYSINRLTPNQSSLLAQDRRRMKWKQINFQVQKQVQLQEISQLSARLRRFIQSPERVFFVIIFGN
jgi:hypothetical protein